MSETQKFAKIEKTLEGLRGLSDLPKEERKKNPGMIKYREELNKLSKKDKEEFFEKSYQDSQNDKEWQEQQKYQKLFEKEIRPNTKIVYFWLGEGVVKERKLLQEKEAIKKRFVSEDELKKEIIQNIEVPEIVDIDYSEIKDIPVAKYGSALKPYKDGFLIVRDDNPKTYHNFEISNYINKPNIGSKMFFHSLIVKDNCHYYLRADDVEKVKDHKNNLNLYFVYKRAYKNKAFKITLKNNKYFAYIFKCFEKDKSTLIKKEQIVLDVVSSLPSDLITNYIESLAILERYETLKDIKDKNFDTNESLEKEYLSISNEKILKAGYYFSILCKFLSLVAQLKSILLEDKKEDFKGTILRPFAEIESKDPKLLTKVLLKSIEKSNVGAKDMIPVVKENIAARRNIKKEGITDVAELTLNVLNLLILYLHTEKGTSLPLTGKINVENATEIDCFYYWSHLNIFNLVNGCLDKKDFPLLLEEGKIFNENEFYKHVHEAKKSVGESPFRNPNETFNLDAETKDEISEILNESMNQSTGLLIPYNACVELKDDPVFKYVRFIEYEKYIAIFAHDYNDRFIAEMYVKGEDEFRYWLYNSGQVFDSKVSESSKRLYLKLAACIRDWKVLIERDSTMLYRGSRVPTGVKSSRPRYIYLPRVSYKRSETREQKSREKIFFNESRKFSGDRREHRRKLRNGMKASKLQMLLAKDANFYVPEGYTFVKKSIWGKIKMSQREIKFRNKSLNGLFYASDAEIEKAKDIHNLSPAGFEEYCEKYVATLGWEVTKRNNYDGGIDIRALKEFKDGTIKQLFVQCKHWTKHISPGAMKEFKASCDEEKSEHEQVFMFITSSRYASGARTYAENYGIELVDGNDLLK